MWANHSCQTMNKLTLHCQSGMMSSQIRRFNGFAIRQSSIRQVKRDRMPCKNNRRPLKSQRVMIRKAQVILQRDHHLAQVWRVPIEISPSWMSFLVYKTWAIHVLQIVSSNVWPIPQFLGNIADRVDTVKTVLESSQNSNWNLLNQLKIAFSPSKVILLSSSIRQMPNFALSAYLRAT